MKVSELSGHDLDKWVSKAEGCRRIHPFSSKWMLAGPIIERERITLSAVIGGQWAAYKDPQASNSFDQYGSTPLEAAMRCYVASKFGDEVPDEIDN